MLRTINYLRKPLSSYSPPSESLVRLSPGTYLWQRWLALPTTVRTAVAAVALVVVPVFFQAPLVRSLPWLSLTLTSTWLMVGIGLMTRPATRLWGDLLIGFAWTWLAGSLYWGWFRWEPFVHIPLESVGIPIALTCLMLGKCRVGSYFYLGSLLGTAVTDLYIYWTDLVPLWRQVMQMDPEWVPVVLREGIAVLQNPGAMGLALVLAIALLIVGLVPLRSRQPCWWAFSGAVLSTLIVDTLFWVSAQFL